MDKNFYDAIVIGAGPAGLTGAMWLGKGKYRVLVIEKDNVGGQMLGTPEIADYPGYESVRGASLASAMQHQAQTFGAEFLTDTVISLRKDGNLFRVQCAGGAEYTCVSILLAVGVSPRKLGFKGEDEFRGKGVASCAVCDGEFFTDCEVFVVGDGVTSAEDAIFLSKYAQKVHLLIDERAEIENRLPDEIAEHDNIDIMHGMVIEEVSGDAFVTNVRLRNTADGTVSEVVSDDMPIGVFVFTNCAPDMSFISLDGKLSVETDSNGCIVSDGGMMTSVEGVFAAGDAVTADMRKIVTAVGTGAAAAMNMRKYISSARKKFDIPKAFTSEDNNAGSGPSAVRGALLSPQEPAVHQEAAVKKASEPAVHQKPAVKKPADNDDAFISDDLKDQMRGVFDRMTSSAVIEAVIAGDSAAAEMTGFARELEGIHEKVIVRITKSDVPDDKTFISVGREGETARIRYYSVPGGHEFTSFVLAIYNTAGPGQELDAAIAEKIAELKPVRVRVMATLSCTNCPEVVTATQRIASLNKGIEAEFYDLAKFPEFKTKYNIMAVPCMIVGEDEVHFGKKTLPAVVGILKQHSAGSAAS